MTCHQTYTTLHHTELVSLDDCICRPRDQTCGSWVRQPNDAIVLVRRGAFAKRIEGCRFVASTNHAAFFTQDEHYTTSHPVNLGDDSTVVRIRRDALDQIAENTDCKPDNDAPWASSLRTWRISPAVQLQHQRLYHALKHRRFDDLQAEELVLCLVENILRSTTPTRAKDTRKPSTRKAHAELVQRVLEFTAVHFKDPLSLDSIARGVASSPFHLCRVFRRDTGMSIHEHVNQLRLCESLHRILDGARTLEEVGLQVGFANRAHFSTAFLNEFGFPPSRALAEVGLSKSA